ncbi:MAG: 4-alpha-glucanotransferase [Pseudomonadota bacterium]|nr:4-alpha-glucanotransferase [Pseudomonadota bacterium]
MNDADIVALAHRAGIAPKWEDFRGRTQEVTPDTLRRLLDALDLPCDSPAQLAESIARLQEVERPGFLPALITATCAQPIALPATAVRTGATFRITQEDGRQWDGRLTDYCVRPALPALVTPGYHRLQIGDQTATLAVAPKRCTTALDLHGDAPGLPWGLAAQIYGLRTPGDGGIGTYGALGQLATRTARDGAAALAMSPVHAMFSAEPAHCSPYSPSSRLLLNVMHIDPAEVFGDAANAARESLGLGTTMARLEAQTLIDWGTAGRSRLALLRHLYETSLDRDPRLMQALKSFRAQRGTALEEHARFEALHAHFHPQGVWSWREWPREYRHPSNAAVDRFAREHAHEVRFHAFLQWLAARGLARAQDDARQAGMAIGLIADLAIGTDPNGSQAWSRQHEMLNGLSIGAPPDALAAQGQNWGLATLSPTAMRDTGFSAFIELLRASMAYAGGIRIDHIMGLMRLWLVPQGGSPLDGAYLAYPRQDLMRLLALESWRHGCMVVGEDLGTVPEGFRKTLADVGMLGLNVLWFERDDDGDFLSREQWRREAVAMTTTHDLPTTAGWWLGSDIEVRAKLGQIDSDAELRSQVQDRERDRDAIWKTVHADVDPAPPQPGNGATAPFVEAAIRHVGCTPSALALVPLEDALGITDAPNVPGTTDEHPNWRRRMPADMDTLLDAAPTRRNLDALDRARGPQE